MLVIRLQRTGRENTATYRIVLAEKSSQAKKGALEIFGHYLPQQKSTVFQVDKERVSAWVKKGAQPSDTMARLLKRAGVDGMEKYIKKYKKQISKKAQAAAAEGGGAAAPAPAAEEKPAA